MPTKIPKPDYKWTKETRTETTRHKIEIIPDINKSLAEITQHLNLEVGDKEERTHTKRLYSYLTITHNGDRDIEPGTVWSRTTTISGRIHHEHPIMMDLRRGYVNIENESWTATRYNTREKDDEDPKEEDGDSEGRENGNERKQSKHNHDGKEDKITKITKEIGVKKGNEEKDVTLNGNNNKPNDHDTEKSEKRKRGMEGTKEKDHHDEEQERNRKEECKNKTLKQDKQEPPSKGGIHTIQKEIHNGHPPK